jgi:transposase
METMYYIGLDVHKKRIDYCVKDGNGRIYSRFSTAWIYDHLRPHAAAVMVAHRLDGDSRTTAHLDLLVRQAVQMKNKIAVLLMEADELQQKERTRLVGYFRELLATNQDIDKGLKPLLRVPGDAGAPGKTESALVRDSLVVERVERLMTIPEF